MSGRVKWYGKELRVKLDEAKKAMLDAAAFAMEAETKAGAAVDTGFMRNSTYVVTPKSNTYGKGASQGRSSSQILAPPASPPANGALMGVAARYTLYVEMSQPFIYPAAEKVAGAYEGRIVGAGRKAL